RFILLIYCNFFQQISTAGLSELAKDRRRIQCLLMYVAEKCLLDSDQNELEPMMPEYFSLLRFRPEGAPIFDTTLRFTLSALWNLTDECPEACLGFVQEGGLQIYEKVLKISTAGLSELAKDRRRIQCLLMYVAEKCLLDSDQNELEPMMPEYFSLLRFRPEGAPIFDTTLRFTLSALWNLTDECPEACLGFVQEGGLQIYEKVLKRFADQEEEIKNHVYTKCLGLLVCCGCQLQPNG
ncbi:hypothetical protein AHF37_09665, partial [Paragonimus kellicotti]